ncbi:hypothetical protein [Candidatus Lokiarchaeum ossiferum]|uniref:hypothetical protein n=1 Tax=Candidatus Lokiarchaeum ossiferum TaxID=2951803 RepID=UPI00352ED078
MEEEDLYQQRADLGIKYVTSVQEKFKINLKRYVEENPEKIPQIKLIAAHLDQLHKKKGPNATILYYKALGSEYTQFKEDFDQKIQDLLKK